MKFMLRYKLLTTLLILVLLFSLNLTASAELDFDFFIKLFSVEKDELDYFAKFDISNDNLSTILYFYSNADRTLTRDQFSYLMKHRYNWRELSIYFGLPPVMFDDEVIRLRRPNRERMQVPLDRKRYKDRYKTKKTEEKVELNPGKYEYYYRNKIRDIEEKIEVKQNKYEYYYKSNQMEEKLSVHMVTNKYEYYFKNFYTGREIKKEGRGRPIDSERLYQELREKYKEDDDYKDDEDDDENEDEDNNINFKFKIEFNF